MSTCPNCGKEITASDKFCSNCGAPLSHLTGDTTQPEPVVDTDVTGPTTGASEDVAPGTPTVGGLGAAKDTPETESRSGWTPPPAVTPNVTPSEPGASRSSFPMPPPVDFKGSERPSVDEEWRMSSLGPPPKRKRSIWLYILIGILALCLLSCVGFIGFSMTDTGQRWIEDLATEAAQQATEAAD